VVRPLVPRGLDGWLEALVLFHWDPLWSRVQGHLAHKKQRAPGTLQADYASGALEALSGGDVSYDRGTPVTPTLNLITVW